MAKAIRITETAWDERSVRHIARHHVTVKEVEEVCFHSKSFVFRRGERYIILGRTEAGRYLFVAVDRVERYKGKVITAREMDDAERRRYRKEVK
jgi:hypothetical protein